jgi:hypothetical protein
MCEYEIAPATPASTTTVAPAALAMIRFVALIGYHPTGADQRPQS